MIRNSILLLDKVTVWGFLKDTSLKRIYTTSAFAYRSPDKSSKIPSVNLPIITWRQLCQLNWNQAEESGWIKLTFQTFWDRVFGVSPRADAFCFFCYPYERQKPSHPHRPIPLVQWCLVYEQRHHDFIPNEHLECAGVVFALPRVKNNIRSRKLTNDNEQFTIFKMYLLLIMGIFQCHVSFQGCNFRNVKQSLSEFTLDLTSKYVKTLFVHYRFCTPPKFNIVPEKWWLEDKPFLSGPGNFSGANC